jgi:hypothetical protein
MNGYLFTAGCTRSEIVQAPNRVGQMEDTLRIGDDCSEMIVCGDDPRMCQKSFEGWLKPAADSGRKATVMIKKLFHVKMVDQLLTETGNQTVDWPTMAERASQLAQTSLGDGLEEGYWVDINQALPPGKISPDLVTLQRDVPEDIRSGLNWAAEKKFIFLVNVFKPLPPPVDPFDVSEPTRSAYPKPGEEEEIEETPPLDALVATMLEMRERQAALLVEARNSVVAAWLWKKNTGNVPLAANDMKVDFCPPIFVPR